MKFINSELPLICDSMNLIRGVLEDSSEWAEDGNEGWSYEVLPFFKKYASKRKEFVAKKPYKKYILARHFNKQSESTDFRQ